MKRSLTIIFHILSVVLVVASFVALRGYSLNGLGISWINSTAFEESVQFSQMVSADISGIKRLAVLKQAFESDGNVDEQKLLVTAESSNGNIAYTVGDVITLAKRFGYSIDSNTNTLTIGNATSANNYQIRVIHKAYDPFYFNNIAPGPSQGVMPVKDMCVEALRCLAEYYALKAQFELEQTNFHYAAYFIDNNEEEVDLQNQDTVVSAMNSYGRYFILDNHYNVDTNIVPEPGNYLPDNESFEYRSDDGSVLEIGIDTYYLYPDRYRAASDNFNGYIRNAYNWLAALSVGCLLALISLVFIVRDKEAERKNRIFVVDKLPIEGMTALFAFAAVAVYGLFRVSLYNVMEVLAEEGSWSFWCKTAKSIVTYAFFVVILCSMYRRSYSGGIFKNSLTHRALVVLTDDNEDVLWTTALSFSLFMALNFVCIGGIVWCMMYMDFSRFYMFGAIGLAAVCVVFDLFVYVKVYSRNRQRGILNRALKRIADGEVSYTISEEGFNGGELEAARSINSISDGLSRAINEQVKADRLKADLITNVSHDIKTPLTSIINYVDLIKRENVENEKIREYIDVLDRKSARLKNLTEDLVEASKASSGNIKMDMCKLNMSELAGQAGGEFEDKFGKRNLEFILTTPDEPVFILADGRHLWRVFENLLNNAAKYAMENTRIYAEVKKQNGDCIFAIKNVSQDRLNISPDELTERFIRGDVSRSTEGSGLGLSIAKSLTTLMGGKLVIEIDGDLYKASVHLPEYQEPEEVDNTNEQA